MGMNEHPVPPFPFKPDYQFRDGVWVDGKGRPVPVEQARTAYDYVVGLPVVVTVRDDGTVSYWIDTAEAGTAIRKEADNPENDPHGDLTEVNARLIDLDHESRNQ